MRDSFSDFHPMVNFIYFTAVILFSMFFMHPVSLIISLVSAFSYSVMLGGKRALRFGAFFLPPALIFTALLNPAFNHQGVTILFYLKSGNPVTLESVLYGAAAAAMLAAVVLWFSCYNAVMTSDKFIYLFGRLMPALSLVLSMVLRFVPRYAAQLRVISGAQACVGRDASQGRLLKRARRGLTLLSIMTTWALESAIETADSMRARGYGLPGRTSFSLFRAGRRDRAAAAVMLALALVILAGGLTGQTGMRFFPSVALPRTTLFGVLAHASYLVLCMLPVLINFLEEIKWRHIESRI